MTHTDIMTEICQAMTLDDKKIQEIVDLYEMDTARFDKNTNEVKDLFMVLIGPSKGEIAYKIYKSRTNT